MADKRAYNITNGEVSVVFWGIQLIITIFVIISLIGMMRQVTGNPGLVTAFLFFIVLLCVALFFSFISMALPNYLISKYNLNIFVDKITNPDFIGWLRITRNKGFRSYTVPRGALGQTKGMANGHKADVIDDGQYTVTLPNGNQAIIVCDFLSNNINLENVRGWQLIKKHFGMVGFNVWDRAVETDNLLIGVDESEEENRKE